MAHAGRRPIDVAWASVAVAAPAIVALAAPLGTVDLAYQLRAGAQILDEHSIPNVDTWTFTVPGTRWVDQQWAAQVVLELTHRAGGWPMLVVLRGVLVALSSALLLLACRARGASIRTAALLTLASFSIASPGLALRPQLFGVALFCLVLWSLASAEEHVWRLALVPVAAWLLSMMHGSFVLVPIVAALAWLAAWRGHSALAKRYFVVAVVSAVVTLLTPLGFSVWTYAVELSSNDVVRDLVTEWRPTSVDSTAGVVFFVSAVAVAGYLARRATPAPWPALVTLAVFFVLALYAQRSVLWWALVAPIVVAGLLGSSSARTPAVPEDESWLPVAALLTVLTLALIVVEPFHRADPDEDLLVDAPVALAAAVDELPDGVHLFPNQRWASWLEQEAPGALVFVDSRFELLTDDVAADYLTVATGRVGWEAVLQKWDVEAIAVPPSWPIVALLRSGAATSDRWRVVFDDEESVLLVRGG